MDIFIDGNIERARLTVTRDLTIGKDCKLLVKGDLEIPRNLVIQYGGSLIIHGNLEVNNILQVNGKSVFSVSGNVKAGRVVTLYGSQSNIEGNLIASICTMQTGSQMTINGSITIGLEKTFSYSLGIGDSCSLTVKNSINTNGVVTIGRSCCLCIGENIQAEKIQAQTKTVIRVYGNVESKTIIIGADTNLCVTKRLITCYLTTGNKSLIEITRDVSCVNMIIGEKTEINIMETLDARGDVTVSTESKMSISKSMHIHGSLTIKGGCILKVGGLLSCETVKLSACHVTINGNLLVRDVLDILTNAYVCVEGSVTALTSVIILRDSTLLIECDIKTPLLFVMSDNIVNINKCMRLADVVTLPESKRESDNLGLMVGCNNTIRVKDNAYINERIQMDYRSVLSVSNNLLFKGRLVLKVIRYIDTSRVMVLEGNDDNKRLNPIVRVHGNMTIESYTNENYIFIVDGDIEIKGKLRYDMTNKKLASMIESLTGKKAIKLIN